jgi:hypothetical protein
MRIRILTSILTGLVAFAVNSPAFATPVPVPEPASLGRGILGLGVFALSCVRPRR